MVNIIEKVTKEKFPQWMKANIFDPLGMNNTYVEDRYDRVVPNNATSYYNTKGEFFRAIEYWGYVGSGNMHSTTTDLLNWLQNFSTSQPNWSSSFKTLLTTHKLNNGSENNYAYGVIIDNINGYERIQHGGSVGGFRAYASTYPEEQLSIVILTNLSSSNPRQKERQIANILLPAKEEAISAVNESVKTQKAISMSGEQLKQFEGLYWNDKENYVRKIYVKNDTLRYFRSENNENKLLPVSPNEFKMLGISELLIATFDKDEAGMKSMKVSVNDDTPSNFENFEKITDPQKFADAYAGRFYSPELESAIDIEVRNGKLWGHHARHGDFPMNMLKKDVLEIPGIAIVKFERDNFSTITGIRVSNGRARNVLFEKQK